MRGVHISSPDKWSLMETVQSVPSYMMHMMLCIVMISNHSQQHRLSHYRLVSPCPKGSVDVTSWVSTFGEIEVVVRESSHPLPLPLVILLIRSSVSLLLLLVWRCSLPPPHPPVFRRGGGGPGGITSTDRCKSSNWFHVGVWLKPFLLWYLDAVFILTAPSNKGWAHTQNSSIQLQ